jgi:hypothetical protein
MQPHKLLQFVPNLDELEMTCTMLEMTCTMLEMTCTPCYVQKIIILRDLLVLS